LGCSEGCSVLQLSGSYLQLVGSLASAAVGGHARDELAPGPAARSETSNAPAGDFTIGPAALAVGQAPRASGALAVGGALAIHLAPQVVVGVHGSPSAASTARARAEATTTALTLRQAPLGPDSTARSNTRRNNCA